MPVGGKSAGRVSIRVIPDATKFRNDLKLLLKRAEQSMSANLTVRADTDEADASMRRFVKKWSGETVTLNTDVDSKVAQARLAVASRARVVPFHVEVSKASLVKATTLIASLTGARLVGDYVSRLSSTLQNLDKNLPKIALVATSIASLVSVLLSSVGGLVTVGAGLASIAGAALALPGILAGAATGGIVLAIALSKAGEQLEELSPLWERLGAIIQTGFWDKARQPILDLVNNLFPQLEAGLSGTAQALGAWASSLATGFSQAFGGGVLEGMLTNLNTSIDIASGGTASFASAIATLGTVGSSYLPRFAQWFSDINAQFDGWLAAAAADGRLTAWIDQGIVALGQLGGIIANTGGILSGLFTAAEAAGGGGLATLEQMLGQVATIVQSPEFQYALTTLFEGAAAAMSGLATALAPIGGMFYQLAPVIAEILTNVGSGLGTLLSQLAGALGSQVFQTGLTAFFDGILAGLEAVGPALPSLIAGFAAVGTFAGALAAQLGPILGSAIETLVPVLTTLLEALLPILPVLAEGLLQALPSLGESFIILIEAIVPLLPLLAQFIGTMLPTLAAGIRMVAPLIAFLFQKTPIADFALILLEVGAGFIQFIMALQSGMSMGVALAKTFAGGFGSAFQSMATVISSVFDGIRGAISAVVGFVASAFNSVFAPIRGGINGLIGMVNSVIRSLNGLSVKIPDWVPGFGGQTFGVHLPTIPSLGDGGTVQAVDGGRIIRVSERGRDESIVDAGLLNQQLSLTSRMIEQVRGRGDAPGISIGSIVAPPEEDPRVFARMLGREFADQIAGS